MEDVLKFVSLITFSVTFVVFAGYGLFTALGGIEGQECTKWQSEAKQFPNYYLTQWQKQQCDQYKIGIEAPVK